ncbi:MAG: S8 family serine peptidase [Vescimonas sp.]|uniref:S8 family serine peptidase n=1 Tax=Vescimonas sp. TaxID=2892404 RepID=UPI002A91434F|nr:S8 family serine peptidase [Vescimonas sp.]MDY5334916.1 S8 family serine peptidase [Vescimonas sp.]
MKKRILAMLLSVVMLASTVELTSLLTGTNILAGTEAPAVTDTAPTSDTDTASGGQRITDEDTAAIRLSGSELSVSGDIEPDTAQPSSGGTAMLDENNALTIPYDLAFPEEFASDDCLYAGDQIMVKFARGFRGKLNTTLVRAGITGLEKLMDTSTGVWYIASVTGDVQQVMANVRALDNVVLAEYDYMYAAADTTLIDSDTVAEAVQGNASCQDQWYLRSGNLQKSWDLLRTRGIAAGGDSSVVVAVIDTGVDYTHEDLKDNIWVNTKEIPGNGIDDDGNGYIDDVYGVDLETGRDSGMDDNGHGTHVAGIIAASNNHIGVVGLAYNVKLMPIKAGMASGFFTQSQIAKGILYAYNNGADVINMSFGGKPSDIAVQEALETAYTRCVLVAAAGNDAMPNEGRPITAPTYPAALSYVMGVMSVDMWGVESGFTNYDVRAYSSVEYEVYAPGSQILSTIPGNRYATWSGTSMAAPYVSAMAALLRSAYPDTNTYPTKFIYGQIAATGGRSAICCDPKAHGVHNLPKIVDIYNALTQLPKPEVSAADFLVFDDKSLSDQNNGDGVIDAGETVALAFTLRNRWGAAKDVTLSLDARSQADIDCPYIEFLTNNVNYGNVGTYASIDYGKTKEGTFVTGVDADKSLLVKIADDCPNDYIIALNITVTAKNDLDADDTKVYSSEAKTTINVRRGTILPSIITEDMTLTKDHYYILPNATLIQEGVTVTVEPGTQLQFWTDDPHDAYADTAITYLKVDGTLLCQGSEDEHIRMFPSELMSQYRVQLYESYRGTIKLYYTDVVNPYLRSEDGNYGITYAGNCEFSQNYRAGTIYKRFLSSGTVMTIGDTGYIYAGTLKDCAFYKLGGEGIHGAFSVAAPCDGCIFVDSAVELNERYEYTDCVFYGNNNYLNENSGGVSSYIHSSTLSVSPYDVYKDPDTGSTYLFFRAYNCSDSKKEQIASYFGGKVAEYSHPYSQDFRGFAVEIADTTVTDITLPESEITMDTGMTKQLLPEVAPVKTALVADLKYTSLDKSVVTVSDTGLITPVAAGGTLVRVSNADGSVYRDVAVHVADCVPLESLTLNEDALRLPVGTSEKLTPVLAPVDTTRTGVVYESANEDVATVDRDGTVHAVAVGTTVITARPAMGEEFAASVTVTVVQPAESISFEESFYVTTMEQTDDDLKLTITPATATERDVTWESSNPDVCEMSADGRLIKHKNGTATLRATLTGTGLSAELVVCISDAAPSARVEDIQYFGQYNTYYGRLSDGTLWRWGSSYMTPQKLSFSDVDDFAVESYYEYGIYILSGGALQYYNGIDGTVISNDFNYGKPMTGVKKIAAYNNIDPSGCSYYALKQDGSAWAWGSNSYGQLGDGTTSNHSQAVQTDISEPVVDVIGRNNYTLFLTESGNLYGAGETFGSTPVLITDGVSAIAKDYSDDWGFTAQKGQTLYYYCRSSVGRAVSVQGCGQVVGGDNNFYIQDGSVFGTTTGGLGNDYGQLGVGDTNSPDGYVQMRKITGALQVWNFYGTTFIQTDDGFYGAGRNENRALANLTTENSAVPVRIFFGLQANEEPFRLEQTNITNDILTDSDLVLDFSESLLKADNFGTITLKDGSGELVSLRRTLHLDKLTLTPVSGFTDGMSYTLTLPAGALQTKFGATSETLELTFTYQAPAPVEEDSLTLGKTVLTGVLSSESGTKVDLGEIKEAFKLEFKCVSNPDASITWTVADNAVAMVENGNLIALSTGCTTVTAALDGTDLTASALLYVSEDASVTVTKSVQNGAESTVLFSNGALFTLHADGTTQQLFTDAVDFHWDGGALWVKTADALYRDNVPTEDLPISVKYTNLLSRTSDTVLVGSQTLILTADKTICQGENLSNIAISGGSASSVTSGNQLLITPSDPLVSGTSYTVTIPENSISTYFGAPNEELTFTFTYLDTLTADAGEGKTVLASGAVSDNEAAAARAWTSERLTAGWKAFCDKGYDTLFYGNAILNRFTENNVEKWLRITAPSASSYVRYGIGGNYWGTEGLSEKTKKEAINKQILDFDDYQSMADLNEGTILETIPETVWPVVRSVSLRDANGEAITTVGAGKTTFTVTFNRDMDTEMPLQVRFGSSYPYADFEVAGQWLDSRTWEGSTTMTSLIANGIQYWSIANGRSAEGHLKLYKDWGRFSFNIDTSSALAMTMQAEAADDGVILTWAQDDFDTLAGYNVYRCDREDGQYAKLNTSVIPADVKTFTDTNVTPGQMYYYNFTVVKTDLSESDTSGKISVRAKDTMAPNIYHDGVYSAFTGGKLIISATANDNLQIDKVELFYRVTGTESWKVVTMTAVNDRYSAVIPSSDVTTDGLEYYIRAFDGVNYAYKGTAEQPYAITVSEAVDRSALGDVNGDGQINVLDALMVLQAINDRLNLDAEQFARADLNGNKTLEAVEVLTILQYANGIIGSLTL